MANRYVNYFDKVDRRRGSASPALRAVVVAVSILLALLAGALIGRF